MADVEFSVDIQTEKQTNGQSGQKLYARNLSIQGHKKFLIETSNSLMGFVSDWVENITGKGEKQVTIIFYKSIPTSFQKSCFYQFIKIQTVELQFQTPHLAMFTFYVIK